MDDKDIAMVCLTIIALAIIISSVYINKFSDYSTILASIIGAIAGIATGRKKSKSE